MSEKATSSERAVFALATLNEFIQASPLERGLTAVVCVRFRLRHSCFGLRLAEACREHLHTQPSSAAVCLRSGLLRRKSVTPLSGPAGPAGPLHSLMYADIVQTFSLDLQLEGIEVSKLTKLLSIPYHIIPL